MTSWCARRSVWSAHSKEKPMKPMKAWCRVLVLSMALVVHLWFRFAAHLPTGCAQGSDCKGSPPVNCCDTTVTPFGDDSRPKPTPPFDLKATALSPTSVSLTWIYTEDHRSSDAWELYIYRRKSTESGN